MCTFIKLMHEGIRIVPEKSILSIKDVTLNR